MPGWNSVFNVYFVKIFVFFSFSYYARLKWWIHLFSNIFWILPRFSYIANGWSTHSCWTFEIGFLHSFLVEWCQRNLTLFTTIIIIIISFMPKLVSFQSISIFLQEISTVRRISYKDLCAVLHYCSTHIQLQFPIQFFPKSRIYLLYFFKFVHIIGCWPRFYNSHIIFLGICYYIRNLFKLIDYLRKQSKDQRLAD